MSRALRRLENDWFYDDWPVAKRRHYESPYSVMEDMSRQMASTMNQMQDWVSDLETLSEIATKMDETRPRSRLFQDEAVIKRTENGNLQLALDVSSYKPEDLKIMLVDDNLVVEANSETSGKDSYQKNHFKRWFRVPEDCKLDEIKSKITEDNKLLIDLPLEKPIPSNERSIPIHVEAKKPSNKADNTVQNESLEQGKQQASN